MTMVGCRSGAADALPYGRYLGTDEFLDLAFGGNSPDLHTLWMTREIRAPLERMLGHPFNSLRVRYWQHDHKTAWIIDEVGKELPITIGVVIDNDAIELVRILEFRETRGWEVRYPFFTDQFRGVSLTDTGELDARIDGITGATLSVHAATHVAEAALYLHEVVSERQ